MGKFFNQKIMNMPNSVLKRLRKSVKVTDNPVFGQTRGFLEELRKDFNKPPLYVSKKDKKKDG